MYKLRETYLLQRVSYRGIFLSWKAQQHGQDSREKTQLHLPCVAGRLVVEAWNDFFADHTAFSLAFMQTRKGRKCKQTYCKGDTWWLNQHFKEKISSNRKLLKFQVAVGWGFANVTQKSSICEMCIHVFTHIHV